MPIQHGIIQEPKQESNMLDQLPGLCLVNIAEQLYNLYGRTSDTLHASIALGRASSDCAEMASHIYNLLDPDCVDILDKKRIKRDQDVATLQADALAGNNMDYSKLSLAELREECVLYKCPKTGTKAKLIENLVAENKMRAHLAQGVLSKLKAIPAKKNPLRSNVRNFLCGSSKLITVTTAKSLGADEQMLQRLHCEYRKNPHDRRGFRLMRLYVRSEVLRQLLDHNGPGDDGIQDATDMLLELAKHEKKELAKAKKAKLDAEKLEARQVQLDQFLSEYNVSSQDFKKVFDASPFLNGTMPLDQFKTSVRHRVVRMSELVLKLANHGCALRSDSRLCNMFIRDGHGDVDEIAIVMCEMKFYYDHTTYSTILSNMYADWRDRRRGMQRRGTWDDYSDDSYDSYDSDDSDDSDDSYDSYSEHDDCDVSSEDAKAIALDAYIASFPTVTLAIASPAVPCSIRTKCIADELNKQVVEIINSSTKYGKQMTAAITRACAKMTTSYKTIESFDRTVIDEYLAKIQNKYNELQEEVPLHIEFDQEAFQILFGGKDKSSLKNAVNRHDLDNTLKEFGLVQILCNSWKHLLGMEYNKQALELRRLYTKYKIESVMGDQYVLPTNMPELIESLKVVVENDHVYVKPVYTCKISLDKFVQNQDMLRRAKKRNAARKAGNGFLKCYICNNARLFCAIGLASHTAAVHARHARI